MISLREVLTTIQPFTDELLRLLDVQDTFALSHTCRDIRSQVREHPAAFGVVDLRDKLVAGAYARSEAAAARTAGFDSYISPVEVFHWAMLHTSKKRYLDFTSMGLSLLVFEHPFRIRMLLLDGLQFFSTQLRKVFAELAPRSLEELSLMYTRGCELKDFVKIVRKVGVGKLQVLRVWGMGENNRLFRTSISGTFSWDDEDVKTLLEVAKGVKLDITICKHSRHMSENYSLVEWRNCFLCRKPAKQVHCSGWDSASVCPQYMPCECCGSYYCTSCLKALGFRDTDDDDPRPAFRVCQVCPHCDKLDKLKRCSSCGSGFLFKREPPTDQLGLKVELQLLSDIDPCYICGEHWRCDTCFDPSLDFTCSNCWNRACLSCLVERAVGRFMAKYATPNSATKAFLRELLKVYDDKELAVKIQDCVRCALRLPDSDSDSDSDSYNSSSYEDEYDYGYDVDDDDDTGLDDESYVGEEEGEQDEDEDEDDELPDMENVLGAWLLLRNQLEVGITETRALVRLSMGMFENPIWRGLLLILEGKRKCRRCKQGYLCSDCCAITDKECKMCAGCARPRLFFSPKDFNSEEEYSDDEPDAEIGDREVQQLMKLD